MKIFFIGCVEFSKELLSSIIDLPKIKVVGIATKESSKFNSDHYDLSKIGNLCDVPFKYIKDINESKTYDWIYSLSPDIIFCFGWPSLLKQNILSIPKLGVIGYHPSELPLNRGRHPIIWALVLGLKKTGSTFFLMNEGADTGGIISQKTLKIKKNDDAESLYCKLIDISKKQLKEIISNLKNDSLVITPQIDGGNFWRKRSKKDGLIDWRMSSESIYNLIRGLTKPYVGAHFEFNRKEIKVWKSKICRTSKSNFEPGKVLKISKNGIITVKTGDGSINLIEHELQEKKINYLK
jgi:methionyl-tRNA formyltransferase